MTREEIIEQLNLTIGLIKQDGKDWLDDRDVPMLEECVKALEQEPCEDISPTAVPVTVEEAKRLLRAEWKKEVSKDKSNSRLLVAYKMAVQFLEQEPCDDAISREAVMRLIENKPYDWSNLTERHNMLMEIRKLPSVTQSPKYWIDKDNKIYKMPDDIPTMTIQYPTITHGDTISRTEVMKVISDFVTFEKYIDKHNHITFEPLEQMINALPSVTQKSGKWILVHPLQEGDGGSYMCDCCKWGHPKLDGTEKFCPNCGCRMVEPQERSE